MVKENFNEIFVRARISIALVAKSIGHFCTNFALVHTSLLPMGGLSSLSGRHDVTCPFRHVRIIVSSKNGCISCLLQTWVTGEYTRVFCLIPFKIALFNPKQRPMFERLKKKQKIDQERERNDRLLCTCETMQIYIGVCVILYVRM